MKHKDEGHDSQNSEVRYPMPMATTEKITDEDRSTPSDRTAAPEAGTPVRHEYEVAVMLDLHDAEHLGYWSVRVRAEDLGRRLVGGAIEWTTIGRVLDVGVGEFHAVDEDAPPQGVDPSVRAVGASDAEITYSTVEDVSDHRTTTSG